MDSSPKLSPGSFAPTPAPGCPRRLLLWQPGAGLGAERGKSWRGCRKPFPPRLGITGHFSSFPQNITMTSPLGSSCHPVEEQRARWERKRCRAAKELLETEEQYVEQLGLVTTYFVAILKAKRTLKPVDQEAIFGCLESICSASWTLLFHLEAGRLGLGLEGFCHQLVLYVCYAENLDKAQSTLQRQLRKSKPFARFKKLQESRPEFGGLRLEELLLLPLRRLSQYRHLLEDLVGNSHPGSSDFKQLTGVLKSVSEAYHQVQEISCCRDNANQMRRVQKLLKGQKTRILAPGRWFLREGWLSVVPPKGEELQRRMFFLFSDILLVTKPCHPLHPWNGDKFACQAVLPLRHSTVQKVFGHTQSQGGLLSISFPHTTLLLMSCNQEDIHDWHQTLLAALRQLNGGPAEGGPGKPGPGGQRVPTAVRAK